LRKLAALIRSHFHIDPYKLSDKQFAELAQEALWLQENQMDLMYRAVGKVLIEAFTKKGT